MKTLVLGDTHGRSFWKFAVHAEAPDRVVFIGDYFDSFDIKGDDQIRNFQDIIEFKKTDGREIVMLIGNHDYHYFPEIGDTGTSGYQHLLAPSIQYIIGENREHLQMAYRMDEFLFTHAGASSIFMDKVFADVSGKWSLETIDQDLNDLFRYKPKAFEFGAYCDPTRYTDPYGDDVSQSPIWIRPKSLMNANYDTLRKEVIQVVGHTQKNKIDIKGNSTGGRYYMIDTLGTSGEYLVIEDGSVRTGKIN